MMIPPDMQVGELARWLEIKFLPSQPPDKNTTPLSTPEQWPWH